MRTPPLERQVVSATGEQREKGKKKEKRKKKKKKKKKGTYRQDIRILPSFSASVLPGNERSIYLCPLLERRTFNNAAIFSSQNHSRTNLVRRVGGLVE